MHYSTHILTKEYMDPSVFASVFMDAANRLHLSFEREADCDDVVSEDRRSMFKLFYNDRAEYDYSIRENYYPEQPGYGANVVIGYRYGGEDTIFLPFLREVVASFPQIIIYASDRFFTPADLETSTTTDAYSFFSGAASKSDNIV